MPRMKKKSGKKKVTSILILESFRKKTIHSINLDHKSDKHDKTQEPYVVQCWTAKASHTIHKQGKRSNMTTKLQLAKHLN